jgi:exoribonuclease R
MLIANKLIAEFLIKNDKKPIMRIHNEPKFQMDLKDCDIENKDTLNFLNYYQMECAVYKEYNQENDYNYYHYGLNLKYYSHFTSPIRRIVDIMIHLQVKEVLTNTNSKILKKLKVDIEKVNIQQKKDKKMYRELEKINIINNKLRNDEYESYIVDIKSNKISIFIPELKHLYRKQLFNKKLLSMLKQEVTDDKIIIKNINNNKKIEFNKYQKLNVKLNKNINELDVILDERIMNIF